MPTVDEKTYIRFENTNEANSISYMALAYLRPARRRENDASEAQSSREGRKSEKDGTRTEDLVRHTDVAMLPTLGVGQVGVMMRKLFLALVPSVGQLWACIAF